MLHVMEMHCGAVGGIAAESCPNDLLQASRAAWDEAIEAGRHHGYRNAQTTVIAPTGTIGFMMDCDTTGIEPDIALVKYKNLTGGGMFKIVNQTVPQALARLGYSKELTSEILEYIDENDTIEGAAALKEDDLPVFDCAFQPAQGSRSIHYMGHIRMMAAVQPFISGAISKTVNMPNEATVDDIIEAYVEGWRLGVKALAIYRDGSKRTQPLNTSKGASQAKELLEATGISLEDLEEAKRAPHRERLPATRPSMTHKFDVAGHEGYVTVGLYENGAPGEVFVTMAKEGSTVGGMMDAFATAISLCLQYGVPLEALVRKFTHQRFEPSGMTTNRNIPFAKSVVDYLFRWLQQTFLDKEQASRSKTEPTTDANPAGGATLAAPEAVMDDAVPSEPGRARQTSRTEARRSVGALLEGLEDDSPPSRSGGNGGARASATATATQPAIRMTTTRLTPAKAERIDLQFSHFQQDAPPCPTCGSITVRNGNCYKCHNCGSSLGCS
jgi:ribonucleoside-diphosphate reductase alpha chain